ncbi:hypothetical protein DPMN_106270 [Dreissena polymorpha]|uniref:Uncharacterized protein n=1 Tax=Dreissena polymorpha TaxID=45954 RepID=A0A9D4K4U2_DREPO|nr:hypothetical protein DPMN_106270 [Dreissena polymorpha]
MPAASAVTSAQDSASSFSSHIRLNTVPAASAAPSAKDSASIFSSLIRPRQCQQLQQPHPPKTVPAASLV